MCWSVFCGTFDGLAAAPQHAVAVAHEVVEALEEGARGGGVVDAQDVVVAHLLRSDDVGDLVREARCEGTLQMRPLKRHATIAYDLYFEDAAGREHTLRGEKHTRGLGLLRGMTTLHTVLRCEGLRLGSGILTFDMADLGPFLQSFGLGSGDRSEASTMDATKTETRA